MLLLLLQYYFSFMANPWSRLSRHSGRKYGYMHIHTHSTPITITSQCDGYVRFVWAHIASVLSMGTKSGANFCVFLSRSFYRHVKEMDREHTCCRYTALGKVREWLFGRCRRKCFEYTNK